MAAGDTTDRLQLPGLYSGQFSRQKAAWHVQIPHIHLSYYQRFRQLLASEDSSVSAASG